MNTYKREMWNRVVRDLWRESAFNTLSYEGVKTGVKLTVLDDSELAMLDLLCAGVQTMRALQDETGLGYTAVRERLTRFEREGWAQTDRKRVQGGTLRVYITEAGRVTARTPCEEPLPVLDSPDGRRLHSTRKQA